MKNQLPAEAVILMEQFLRDASKLGCGVFGIVFQIEPEPGMGLMRTSDQDPVAEAEAMLRLIKRAKQDGRLAPQLIEPVN
jgi:hypothetical protein